jgi:hypothetical protein
MSEIVDGSTWKSGAIFVPGIPDLYIWKILETSSVVNFDFG